MNDRLQAIVDGLGIGPGDAVLEIGCGHGVAADLICQRLTTGRFVAIDRSQKMIEAAKRRNARHIAAGVAEFITADLEEFDPGGRRFDLVLAVRVGLFHREPQRARRCVARWLKPGGRLHATFDVPTGGASVRRR